MAAVDIVLDFTSHLFDQDLCDSNDIYCVKCQKLIEYLKIAITELKSAQRIIGILHEEKVKPNNLKNYENSISVTNKTSNHVKCLKGKSVSANQKNEIMDNVKHKIRIIGLANELKDKLTCEFEYQGMVKPGSILEELVINLDSDLKDLSVSDVCVVWGGSKDVARNESNLGIRAIK
jgi:hypothetical protein